MKILRIDFYPVGGIAVVACENSKMYYVDNRWYSKTVGEVFDIYPLEGNVIPIPKSEMWELVAAIKEYDNIEQRKAMLHLLGTG